MAAAPSPSLALNRLIHIFLDMSAEDGLPHGKGWFSKPIDIVALNIPDYPSIVKHPMDFGTIESKFNDDAYSGSYAGVKAMAADILLTFNNAIRYNGSSHPVGAEAFRLKLYFLKHYERLAAEIGDTVPGQSVSAAAAAQPPSTPAAVAANAASKKAGAGSAAAAASSSSSAAAAAASGSKDWIVPDLAITDAIRPRILGILNDLQTEVDCWSFSMDTEIIKAELLNKSLRSVAEVDVDVERILPLALDANDRFGLGTVEQTRQLWRTKITELVGQIGREGALPHAPSASAVTASVDPLAAAAVLSSASAASSSQPAASTLTIPAVNSAPMQAASSLAASVVVSALAATPAAAASAPSSSSAADRVERSLMAELGGSVLADLTVVLQQARQHSPLLQRIADLESAQSALLSTLEDQDHSMQRQIVFVKREKIDTEEALIKTTQLKRKGERALDSERKKARATADELESKTEQLEQLNCISCEDARATVAYLPCFHVLHCESCDRKWQGGQDRPAAAGLRSCPSCRGAIVSIGKPYGRH